MKKFALILTLILALLAVPAAVFAQDETPVNGGTLRAAWQARWESLDPHIASSEASFQVLNNVLETLTTFDDEINLIPGLAESWSVSEDGLTWTFNLVQDATFSNGRPFTAEDVVWSWQRLIDPEIASGNSWRLGTGAVIEAVDDYTVTITTEAPQATLPATIASLSTGIMASESLNEEGLVTTPIGTGPFVIGEVEGTTRLVLERNENYRVEGVPYLDSVEITPITDATARELALQGGEVDWIFTVSPQNIPALQADPNIVVEISPRLSYDYFGLNLNREPFSDVRVRQAIAYAIDRQVICDFAFFSLCEAVHGPVASGSPWYFDYAPYERDLDKARQLLGDAGYPDGFTMQMMPAIGFEETIRGAQVVQQQLAEVGITVEIDAVEFGEWLERQGAGDFDSFMLSWLALTSVEDYFFLQHRTGQSFNFTGYSNPEFDALVDQAREVEDFEERYALYEQANKILVDDAPYIYMYAKSEVKAWSPSVHGYTVRADSANNFWTVWLSE